MSKWEISSFGWHGISGVYAVCAFVNNKSIVFYIGSSKNIGERLESLKHPYRIMFEKGLFPYIKFKETDDYYSLECKMIKKIKPLLNKQHNG